MRIFSDKMILYQLVFRQRPSFYVDAYVVSKKFSLTPHFGTTFPRELLSNYYQAYAELASILLENNLR